ncbi:hypothetical protein BTO20_21645 [Mycobacterium dioxanotrophicus]|uniref:Uncharacterized protein n=1 Tax=Mycobacterium dioxanotrophicus TaxID=482462 RepID=A0A1Y0C6Q6_9MYCO|nr:hypothetical protein BTO20_21645 [Mycobacterium dioxanotrophicus]
MRTRHHSLVAGPSTLPKVIDKHPRAAAERPNCPLAERDRDLHDISKPHPYASIRIYCRVDCRSPHRHAAGTDTKDDTRP